MNQTSSEVEAAQPVADSAPKQRHPLAGVLTAIAVALSVLTAAVIGLGVVVLVRTAPAAAVVGPSKSVSVTVTSNYAFGVVTYTTSSATEVGQIDAFGVPRVWGPEVEFGDAVIVTMELTSTSDEAGGNGGASLTCTITSADGAVNVRSSTTVEGGRAQCSWTNDKES